MRLCKEFGTLPYPGALFNQPYGHILRMEAVLDAVARNEQVEMRRAEARSKADQAAREHADKAHGT